MSVLEEKMDLISILSNEPREPFSLNVNMHIYNDNIELLFSKIRDIYFKGLNIQMGIKGNKLSLDNVEKKHMDIIKKHMLAMGIDVKYRNYTRENKDCLYREFLYDIQNIDDIDIKVLLDWKKNLIDKIEVSLKLKNGNTKLINDFENKVRKHFEVNHFLKFMKPKYLKDYAIIIKKSSEKYEHVIYFDFAKRDENILNKINAFQNFKLQ